MTSYGVRIGFDGIAIAQDGRIEPRNGIFPEEIVGRASRVNVGTRARNKMSAGEKLGITAACEKFIADVLKPRFLPEIRPTEFNYPVAIYGQWHGTLAIDPTIFTRTSRSSTNRLRASNTSAATVSTCPTGGIRTSGSACFEASRSLKLWI